MQPDLNSKMTQIPRICLLYSVACIDNDKNALGKNYI